MSTTALAPVTSLAVNAILVPPAFGTASAPSVSYEASHVPVPVVSAWKVIEVPPALGAACPAEGVAPRISGDFTAGAPVEIVLQKSSVRTAYVGVHAAVATASAASRTKFVFVEALSRQVFKPFPAEAPDTFANNSFFTALDGVAALVATGTVSRIKLDPPDADRRLPNLIFLRIRQSVFSSQESSSSW